MFTGIITDVGKIIETGSCIKVSTDYDIDDIVIGASVAFSGICLTVTDKGYDSLGNGWLQADVSLETMERTTVQYWRCGDAINLERAVRVGDELGGHFVLGHVDGVATIKRKNIVDNSVYLHLLCSDTMIRYIAPKGSVSIDGVSLTVNTVQNNTFSVLIIPHTEKNTSFKFKKEEDFVNIEVDVLARYILHGNSCPDGGNL